MKLQSKPIIVQPGQFYYDEEKNDYLVVTSQKGDVTRYSGEGFTGQMETEVFLDRFLPVDPSDIEDDEVAYFLHSFCPPATIAKCGFIMDGE